MKISHLIVLMCCITIACSKVNNQSSPFLYADSIRAKLDCMNMDRPSDSYNYPIYPGMKEWANLYTGQEMANACQIPIDVLKNMSTHAIIQAILEYPLLFDIFHRYQYQMDFETMFIQNNAYIELTSRKDAGVKLIERLTLVNPLTHGAERISLTLEILISQTVFLSQLNHEDKRKVVEITIKNDDLRKHDVALINSPDRATAWILIGKVMIAADFVPFTEIMNGNEQLRLFLQNKGYIYIKEVYGNSDEIILKWGAKYLDKT